MYGEDNTVMRKAFKPIYAKYIGLFFLTLLLSMAGIVIGVTTESLWFIAVSIFAMVGGLLMQYRYLHMLSPVQETEAVEQGRLLINFVRVGGLLSVIGALVGGFLGALLALWLNYYILHSRSESLITLLASVSGFMGVAISFYVAMILIYSNEHNFD